LEQAADLNKPTQLSLPRMSFEMIGLSYDPARKVTSTQTFISALESDKKKARKTFMPVPYNMAFELSVYTKLNDDMLQIVEQILPYFQPSYNLTVELVGSINEKRDIPIVLESISMQDDYEGDYTSRRVLLYTLRFTAKTFMFGPVSSATKDIIKTAKINYISGDSRSTTRDITYSATPRAIKDYTGEVETTITEDITTSTRAFDVVDASGLTAKTYIEIEGEELFINSINGNRLNVKRGQDGTTAVAHVNGAPIKIINAADDALIEFGDDFGFSGSIT
jgi:hypothetical protein